MKYKFKVLFYFLVIALLFACSKDIKIENPTSEWDQTPYIIQYPSFLNKESNQVKSPADNPLTRAGVELGRKLFYEPMLSVNNSISCASCHNSAFAFSDTVKFSKGAFNELTTRNSMPLFNIAFQESKAIDTIHRFFWDGSSPSLERQSIVPILNPIEMASDLKVVIERLQASAVYPKLFKKAFGTDSIYTSLIQKALAQFERTLVSFESKYDEFLATKNFNVFTEEEKRGYALFYSESKPLENIKGADCFHCHGAEKSFYMTDFQFKNNGLQKELTDSGLYRITNKTNDLGKFKTPSLRNLAFTAPYMHNGSKQTLKDVIDFYNTGGFPSPWVDPNIGKHQVTGGLQLTEEQKQDLIAFLLTMTDNNFVKKTEFTKPN